MTYDELPKTIVSPFTGKTLELQSDAIPFTAGIAGETFRFNSSAACYETPESESDYEAIYVEIDVTTTTIKRVR